MKKKRCFSEREIEYSSECFFFTHTVLVLLPSIGGNSETPQNPAVQKSLCAMLTPYVARKLAKETPHEVSSSILL